MAADKGLELIPPLFLAELLGHALHEGVAVVAAVARVGRDVIVVLPRQVPRLQRTEDRKQLSQFFRAPILFATI